MYRDIANELTYPPSPSQSPREVKVKQWRPGFVVLYNTHMLKIVDIQQVEKNKYEVTFTLEDAATSLQDAPPQPPKVGSVVLNGELSEPVFQKS